MIIPITLLQILLAFTTDCRNPTFQLLHARRILCLYPLPRCPMLLYPLHALVILLSLPWPLFIPRILLRGIQQLRLNLTVAISYVSCMHKSVMFVAFWELVAESFDERFAPAYAVLVDEKPGAGFC